MTRDHIIRMALEAGIDAESDTLCRYEGWVEPLERFFHAAYAAGAAAEREACADEVTDMGNKGWDCYHAAEAIRARGQQ